MNVPALIIHCDGSCHPNPNGIGTWAWVAFLNDEEIQFGSGYCGIVSSDVTEFHAIFEALKWIRCNIKTRFQDHRIVVRSDSRFAVDAVNRQFVPHIPALKLLQQAIMELMAALPSVTVSWIAREQNERADELALDEYFKIKPRRKNVYTAGTE